MTCDQSYHSWTKEDLSNDGTYGYYGSIPLLKNMSIEIKSKNNITY